MNTREFMRLSGPSQGKNVVAVACAILFVSATPVRPAERQVLRGHVPAAVTKMSLQPVGRLRTTTNLDLVIGLPLRNQDALTEQLHRIYDPASAYYHHYLTPAQFTVMFGPTEEDSQALVRFARSNNLTVVASPPNRALLHVRASVADIERVFHVGIRLYQHPTETRTFYAPDVEPSLDLNLPLLSITGLDNFIVPHSTLKGKPLDKGAKAGQETASGTYTGPFGGNDFRAAYVPGISLTGAGQVVGIMAFDFGYYTNDITSYESWYGLPNVPIQNVFLHGFTGTPSANNIEISLDMEMVISMAPGISKLIIYGAPTSNPDCLDVLNEMANPTQGEPLPNQLSTSFATFYNASIYQALQQMAAQGQSFFAPSADNGAYDPTGTGCFPPADYPYVTCVGGTELTTSGPGGSWVSETTWPKSGGGISYDDPINFAIPDYQVGIDMSGNGGSTTMRNCPDVAMVASDIYIVWGNGAWGTVGGTSASTPLWAGFMALVNQQAAANGKPPVGFLNPAIYAVGRGASYASCFHDITTGNNTWTNSPNAYYATNGYDLCTGWGTPTGTALINALVTFAGPVYVDFSAPGPGDGTYANAYNTLARGVAGVTANGTIMIKKPGSSPETMTITKPMTIQSLRGAATIGQ